MKPIFIFIDIIILKDLFMRMVEETNYFLKKSPKP